MRHPGAMWGAFLLGAAAALAPPGVPVARADEEPAVAATAPQLEVLEAGREPRRLLAFAPRAKTVQALQAHAETTQTLRVGGREVPGNAAPAMDLRLDYHVDGVDAAGDVTWRALCLGATWPPGTTVGADERAAYEAAETIMRGCTLHGVTSRRGALTSSRVEFSEYLPAATEAKLRGLFRQTLHQGFQAQPGVPVGVGARWTATWTEEAEFASRVVATVEVVALDEHGYETKVDLVQTAEAQDLPAEAFPRADSVRLLAATARGSGRVVQRFDEVVPRELTIALDLTVDLKVGSRGRAQELQRRDQLSLRAVGEAPRPQEAAPQGGAWDPPTADEALAATRALLAGVRSKTLEGLGAHVDHVAILRGLFGERLDAMAPEERDELLAVHGPAVALRILDLGWMQKAVEEGSLTLGELRALPPRRNRIMVTFTVSDGRRSTDVGWLLERSGGRVLMVDALGRRRTATATARRVWEQMMDPATFSPLDTAREILGLAPDLGGQARKLGIDVPVVPAAQARPVAATAPEVVLLLGRDGRAHVRTPGPRSRSLDVELDAADPQAQEEVRVRLERLFAAAIGARGRDGYARQGVLVRADRRVRWRIVGSVLRLLRGPALCIRNVAFAVVRPDGAEGRVPVDLRVDLDAGEEVPAVGVRLFRRDLDDDDEAHTVIKVGREKTEHALPRGGRGVGPASAERVAQYDATVAAVAAAVGALAKGPGQDAPGLTCRIEMPPPKGGAVPLGDVVRILEGVRTTGVRHVELDPPRDLEEDLEETEEVVEEPAEPDAARPLRDLRPAIHVDPRAPARRAIEFDANTHRYFQHTTAAAVAARFETSRVPDPRTGETLGLRITGWTPDAPADVFDLRRGDVLVSIDGRAVRSRSDAVALVDGLAADALVVFVIDRNGTRIRYIVDARDPATKEKIDYFAGER